jgi:hypothetical protein
MSLRAERSAVEESPFPALAFTATLASFPDLRRRMKTPAAQFLLAGRLWADCIGFNIYPFLHSLTCNDVDITGTKSGYFSTSYPGFRAILCSRRASRMVCFRVHSAAISGSYLVSSVFAAGFRRRGLRLSRPVKYPAEGHLLISAPVTLSISGSIFRGVESVALS